MTEPNKFERFADKFLGSPRRAILIVFLTTILIDVTLALLVVSLNGHQYGTMTEYNRIARHMAEGHGFVIQEGGTPILWRPPLNVYFLALARYLTNRPYLFVVCCQIVMNGLTGVLTFLIGRRFYSTTTAALAALLLAANPLFSINCLRLMSECLFSLLLAAITFLVIRWRNRPGWRTAAVLGIVTGLAALTRASIQYFIPWTVLWALVVTRGKSARKQLLVAATVTLITMAITITPWTIRNYRISGEFIPIDTSGGYTVWVGNRIETRGMDDDPLTEQQMIEVKKDLAAILNVPYTPDFSIAEHAWGSGSASKILMKKALSNMIASPVGTLKLALIKLYRFWFFYPGDRAGLQAAVWVCQPIVLIPACLGIWFALRRRSPALILLPVILYFPLLHMAATSAARYSLPLLPYLSLFAVGGVSGLAIKRGNPHEGTH